MEKVYDGNVQPWTPLGEVVVVGKGYGVKLLRQKFRRPDGREDDYDYVDGKAGVTIFALTTDKKIILKEEFKQGTCRVGLECASAVVQEGEDHIETALRELREETGFEARAILTVPGSYVFGERKLPFGYHLCIAVECQRVGDPTPDAGEAAFNVYLATAEELWSAIAEQRIRACQTVHAAYVAAARGYIAPPSGLYLAFAV